MIEGALILLGGIILGQINGWRIHRFKTPKALSGPRPVCGCSHHLALHDPETGMCHGTIGRDKYDEEGYDVGYMYVDCTCRQYIGPKPADSFFASEVNFNSSQMISAVKEKELKTIE